MTILFFTETNYEGHETKHLTNVKKLNTNSTFVAIIEMKQPGRSQAGGKIIY